MAEINLRNIELFDGERFTGKRDLRISGSAVYDVASPGLIDRGPTADLDLTGMWALPAMCDLHAHLREPGGEHKETVASGLTAAARGGFGAVVSMPNTDPPCDSPDMVQVLRELRLTAQAVSSLDRPLPALYPAAALTKGRAGREPVDFEALLQAGCHVFTDDGSDVADDEVLRRVMQTVAAARAPEGVLPRVMFHAQDAELMGGGVMHQGEVSRRLGLPGIPRESEDRAVARAIRFGLEYRVPVHVTHLTTAGAVELLRTGKQQFAQAGLKGFLTCDVTPHHLTFTDADCERLGALAKVNPPLREPADRAALRDALLDGTIDAVATDHAPHTAEEKALPFAEAPFGIAGLEVALAAAFTALGSPPVGPVAERLLGALTLAPARILRQDTYPGTLRERNMADLAVFDPHAEWEVRPEAFASKCKASPYAGMMLKGRVMLTVLGGDIAYSALPGLVINGR